MSFTPPPDKRKQQLEEMKKEVQDLKSRVKSLEGKTPPQVNEDKKQLLKTTITTDYEILVSDLFPDVESWLPTKLLIKITYEQTKGAVRSWNEKIYHPIFSISAVTMGFFLQERILYRREFDSNKVTEEVELLVPKRLGTKYVKDVLIRYDPREGYDENYITKGKLFLEIDKI